MLLVRIYSNMFHRVAIWFMLSGIFLMPVIQAQKIDLRREEYRQQQLWHFSQNQNKKWQNDKNEADSIAKVLKIPLWCLYSNGQIQSLQRFEYRMPVYYVTHNLVAAKTISVNRVWTDDGDQPALTGKGVTIGIWDGAGVRRSHEAFESQDVDRLTNGDQSDFYVDHSTHVTATIIGSNALVEGRGMASESRAVVFDFDNDLSEITAEALNGLRVSNHSYGTFCGWHFNSIDDMWYWYGDIHVSENEDYKFGWYSQTSADMDFITFNAPNYLMVKSAGNERNDAPLSQPITHYVWNGNWVLSDQTHLPDGYLLGYETLAPMSVAKNILTVGAVDDIPEGYESSADVIMTEFSSWGPTDDGRIKPDVVANGIDLLSALSDDDVSYGNLSGTSMAAASVSGAVALLYELNEKLRPGCLMTSASVKAIIIHTADACGFSSGPDYKYGWGLVNIKKASELIVENWANGGHSIMEEILHETEEKQYHITVPDGTAKLKITLCWTDPPGEVMPYELNPDEPVLVNDLDIRLNRVGETAFVYPWKLNPADPELAAFRGINNCDNVEQLELPSPESGSYLITVSHKNNLTGAVQPFSVVITGSVSDSLLYPPSNLSYRMDQESIALKWYAPENIQSDLDTYRLYRNGQVLCQTTDTIYKDYQLCNDVIYEYSVKAVYGEKESMATNHVYAQLQEVLELPFSFDFEMSEHGWQMKNNYTGWCWGLADTLSAYYLDFSQNTGHIMGINSYSVGEGIHVSDMTLSPPFDLSDYKSVTATFDYVFITDIYEALDTLEFGCQTADGSWIPIQKLPKAIQWTSIEIDLIPDVLVNGVRFGFRFDDHYLWGMGAAVDDFSVDGSLNTRFSNVKQETTVNVFLTPFNHLKISYNGMGRMECVISLFDLLGQCIYNKGLGFLPGEEKIISLPNTCPGCYLVQLRSDTESYVKKIVVPSQN